MNTRRVTIETVTGQGIIDAETVMPRRLRDGASDLHSELAEGGR